MAESALPTASFLAEKLRAVVTLIHVIEKNPPSEVHGESHLRNVEEAQDYLNGISQKWFPKEIKVECHVHASEVDNVAESIVAHADEISHDLIVMTSHGKGKALHLLLGSIAQKVISSGSIPVLLTHPDAGGNVREFSCKSILVPLDLDPDHVEALTFVKGLAREFGASLHLVTVVPSYGKISGRMTVTSRMLPGTTSRMLEMSVEQAEETLDARLKTLSSEGFEASAHVLRGDPADMIAASARESKVDLIVLATHGKSGTKAFWSGSVANKVCSQCKVPLLLIPIRRT